MRILCVRVPALPGALLVSCAIWGGFESGQRGWAQDRNAPGDQGDRSGGQVDPLGPRLPESSLDDGRVPDEGRIPDLYRSRVPHRSPRGEDSTTGEADGVEADGVAPPDWVRRRGAYQYGYFFPQFVPWYSPQTIPYKQELVPPPIAREPRLGLLNNYPYAWQMGLQLPVDTSPLQIPDLPPYTGIVGELKAAQAESASTALPEERAVLARMRSGRYREAGRLLVRGLARDRDPRYALLLAEAFVGLGKYAHAELLVRRAYELAGGEPRGSTMPGSIASRFASSEEFERHVASVNASASYPRLGRYLRLSAGGDVPGARTGTLVAR